MAKLKIKLVRSLIGRPETQRKTVRSLGLHKLNSISILPEHLVSVEEVADDGKVKISK